MSLLKKLKKKLRRKNMDNYVIKFNKENKNNRIYHDSCFKEKYVLPLYFEPPQNNHRNLIGNCIINKTEEGMMCTWYSQNKKIKELLNSNSNLSFRTFGEGRIIGKRVIDYTPFAVFLTKSPA
jgi:hypothetical protein